MGPCIAIKGSQSALCCAQLSRCATLRRNSLLHSTSYLLGDASRALRLDQPGAAYKDLSTTALFRAWLVFQVCSSDFIVRRASDLINLCTKIFGDRLTYDVLIRKTFFNHFCAGENESGLKVRATQLARSRIGSILDYAAEEDVSNESMEAQAASVDADEKACDFNKDVVITAVHHAATLRDENIGPPVAMAALKLSGLCPPDVLEIFSTVIMTLTKAWCTAFCESPLATATLHLQEYRRLIYDESCRRTISAAEFAAGVERLAKAAGHTPPSVAIVRKAFMRVASVSVASSASAVDYDSFLRCVADDLLRDAITAEVDWGDILSLGTRLSGVHVTILGAARCRLREIAEATVKYRVISMVDAEQSYLQPAIDVLTQQTQRTFNTSEPFIFNTYQTYLTYSVDKLTADMAMAEREGWHFGAKIVRGAYIVLERSLAEAHHYESPVFAGKGGTDVSYDTAVKKILETYAPAVAAARADGPSARVFGVVVASHNRDSVESVVDQMAAVGLSRDSETVFFAQLLGMSDATSMALGREGYFVYKYVPYGPIRTVIPYLVRRAQENSGGVPAVRQELASLRAELFLRLTGRSQRAPHRDFAAPQ